MRIAFVPAARLLSDSQPNGEALIAVSILRALASRGHEVVAYCERAEVSIPGVDVREIPVRGITVGAGRIGFARRIARDAARERFDVAHVLFPFNTRDGYTLVRGAPLVIGPVNLPWPGRRARNAAETLTDLVESRLHARTLARAARVFVTGPSAGAVVRGETVPFGVDLAAFPATPVPAERVVAFCSVLDERKGIETLIRAMAHVKDARLVVAGADPNGIANGLRRLARDLSVNAEFLGAVAPGGSARVFAGARIAAQPSFGEPFGMTVIEAMACGRAVAGTNAGGIPDAVTNDGGRLVTPGDAVALAHAIEDCLSHAEAMGAHNRARAEARYDLNKVIDAIERAYLDVTEKEGAHAAS